MNESLDESSRKAMDQARREFGEPDFGDTVRILLSKGIRLLGRLITAPFILTGILLVMAVIVAVVAVCGPVVAVVAAVRWTYGCKRAIPPSWTSSGK